VEAGVSAAERDRRWDQLARLYLAQRLSLYPPGYLEVHPSTEHVLETVERLEEDLTDVATVHRPLAVTVSLGEPLAVTVGGPAPAAPTSDVRDRIEALLDNRFASDRASAPAEPTREHRCTSGRTGEYEITHQETLSRERAVLVWGKGRRSSPRDGDSPPGKVACTGLQLGSPRLHEPEDHANVADSRAGQRRR
jgi:hypothetical protein